MGRRTATLIISLFFLNLAISAQVEYRPFVEEGKTWETTISEIMEDCYGSFIEGDTLIGGETWKKVHNYIGFKEFGGTYYAAVREEGKKVYAIAKGSEKPRLLYDFGLEVGSTVRCGVEGNAFGCLLDGGEKPDELMGFQFVHYLRLEQIDTIEAGGSQRRRFTFTLLTSYHEPYMYIHGEEEEGILGNVVWVEGVGSGAGPFSPWLPLPPRDLYVRVSCTLGNAFICNSSCFYQNCGTNPSGGSNSQSVECFPKGTSWKEVMAEPDEPMDTTHCVLYEIGDETIASGETYRKVLRNGSYDGLLVRESGGRVWVRAEDFSDEVMIYDFNWDGAGSIKTEYVRVNDEVAEKCVEETAPGDIRSTYIGGLPFKYYTSPTGAVLCNIGRVAELNRDACLLGYKIEEPVLPGLIYKKVLWLKRDGKTVFSSDSPDEWTTSVPGTGQPVRGDMDGDGRVSIKDVMDIIDIILTGK